MVMAALPAHANPSLVRSAVYDQADQLYLASELELGVSMPADPIRALAMYCRAAVVGNRTAILHLVGWLLADPLANDNNPAAASWLHRLQFLERGLLPPRSLSTEPCVTSGPSWLPGEQAGLTALAESLAQARGVDSLLVKAVIAVESAWQAKAVSPKGAVGLMQLMPFNFERLSITDPFDPAQNIRAGTAEIGRLLGVFHGDVSLALAAYNAGENAVSRCNCVPNNGETPPFVSRVRALMEGMRPALPDKSR